MPTYFGRRYRKLLNRLVDTLINERRKTMRKSKSLFMVFLGVLMIFSGLDASQAADPREIEIGAFTPPSLGAFLPPVITTAKTDIKNGIKIKWTHKPPKAYNMGYFSGEFKVGASGALLNDAIRRTKGHKTVFLFNTFDYFGTVLSNDPAIKTLKDLEGRKLAAAKVTTNYALYRYLPKKKARILKKWMRFPPVCLRSLPT
jgi:ABC-type nitrate/sulfonate/bicarbonate transport system substrate-binding protein